MSNSDMVHIGTLIGAFGGVLYLAMTALVVASLFSKTPRRSKKKRPPY